jgi:hypothetical protein
MSETQSLALRDDQAMQPMSIQSVVQQITTIQQAMSAVMKDGVHFGKIPGCGDKPTLLQAGAEKLCLVFRLHPELQVTKTELGRGHREYEVLCTLRYVDGKVVGQCAASCSTLESKYRFRMDKTGKMVPAEYWKTRDVGLLGGPQFSPRKEKDSWVIVQKVEHDNPADYYNTCLKMATKRAYVGATRGATGASDIFEQDLEELEAQQEPTVTAEHQEQKASQQTQTQPRVVTTPSKQGTPQDQLSAAIIGAGHNFDQYMTWATATGQLEGKALDAASFDELPADIAQRHVRAIKSIVTHLGGAK